LEFSAASQVLVQKTDYFLYSCSIEKKKSSDNKKGKKQLKETTMETNREM